MMEMTREDGDAEVSSFRIWRTLRPVDALGIAFALILCAMILYHPTVIPGWELLVGVNLLSALGIAAVAAAAERGEHRIAAWVHDWYPVAAIFLVFKEMHIIIQSTSRDDWDTALIAIDRAIFGADPTVWLAHHSVPFLTEILQIAYVSYYFIMLTVGITLFLREDHDKFSYTLFVITYGFFLSYLGYFTFPAVGPRFTLHDFASLDKDLPGLWLTNGIRAVINAGESIPAGIADALKNAQRDAFPSGHTEMTLLSLYLAFRERIAARWILAFFGTLLIISTVYLRYHYVIDVAGGVLFMLVTVWTAPKLFAFWERLRLRR